MTNKRHGRTTLLAAMNIVDGTVIGSNMQCTAQSPDANSRASETIVASFHRELRAGTAPYDGTMIHVIERVFGGCSRHEDQ